jgi:hypothetical protein
MAGSGNSETFTGRFTDPDFYGKHTTISQEENMQRQVIGRVVQVGPEDAKTQAVFMSNTRLADVSDITNPKIEYGIIRTPGSWVKVLGTTAANGTDVAAGGTDLWVGPDTQVRADGAFVDPKTGEKLFVNTIASTGAISLAPRGSRQKATVVPGVITANTSLIYMGTEREEGFPAPSDPIGIKPEFLYNRLTTKEMTTSTTTLANQMKTYLSLGGNVGQLDSNNKAALGMMGRFIENEIWFGRRTEPLTTGYTGRPFYAAGGIRELTTVAYDLGGSSSYADFMDFMSDAGRVSGPKKYTCWSNNKTFNTVKRMCLEYEKGGGSWLTGSIAAFGLVFNTIRNGNVEFSFFTHELFENSAFDGEMYAIRDDNFYLAYTSDGRIHRIPGIEKPEIGGGDNTVDQFRARFTVIVPNPIANVKFTSIGG